MRAGSTTPLLGWLCFLFLGCESPENVCRQAEAVLVACEHSGPVTAPTECTGVEACGLSCYVEFPEAACEIAKSAPRNEDLITKVRNCFHACAAADPDPEL